MGALETNGPLTSVALEMVYMLMTPVSTGRIHHALGNIANIGTLSAKSLRKEMRVSRLKCRRILVTHS
jgi:hypothetical protein